MEVAIVTKHIGQVQSGVDVYIDNLAKHLNLISQDILALGSTNTVNSSPIISTKFDKFIRRFLCFIWLNAYLPLLVKYKGIKVIHMPRHIAPLIKPCKMVLTVHDLYDFMSKQVHTSSFRILMSFFLPRALRSADLIISVSHNTKKDLMDLFKIEEEKIKVIHSGVNVKFKPVDDKRYFENIKKRYRMTGAYILSVGDFDARKNTLRLVDSFFRLKRNNLIQHQLVLVGRKGSLYASVLKRIKQFSLDSEVVLPGYIPAEDLQYLYTYADLFVFPSLYEGFGFPVLEAMACGTPVVTSSTSSLPELAAGAAILINPYDVGEMADAMLKVLSDKQKSQELRHKGFERVNFFTWEKTATETIKAYEELLP